MCDWNRGHVCSLLCVKHKSTTNMESLIWLWWHFFSLFKHLSSLFLNLGWDFWSLWLTNLLLLLGKNSELFWKEWKIPPPKKKRKTLIFLRTEVKNNSPVSHTKQTKITVSFSFKHELNFFPPKLLKKKKKNYYFFTNRKKLKKLIKTFHLPLRASDLTSFFRYSSIHMMGFYKSYSCVHHVLIYTSTLWNGSFSMFSESESKFPLFVPQMGKFLHHISQRTGYCNKTIHNSEGINNTTKK